MLSWQLIRKWIDFISTECRSFTMFEHAVCQEKFNEFDFQNAKRPLTNIQSVFNSQADFILDKVRARITHIACFILLVIRVIFVFESEWNLVLLDVSPLVLPQTSSPLFQV